MLLARVDAQDLAAANGNANPKTLPALHATARRRCFLATKRAIDILAASALLAFLAPLMSVVAIFVAIDGGPVLFRHQRSGRGGAVFDCLKFRTMIADAEETFEEYLSYHPEARPDWDADRKLRFDPRLTAIGRVLRTSSLDELPRLLNVLRGDMSLVGPRAITVPEVALYGDRLHLYQSLRPGLTGLWHVSGLKNADLGARVALDERYVLGVDLLLDLSILLRTIPALLRRRGAR
ncbi:MULTISPECIES: sugar transferase [unclassified Methylobacterium]|uniref:sugar transferase n=1 Tax=unclassified Methylobacterium TaxID=2615210 RepID=UPI00226A51FF|nr:MULTISPECIES: sugar transferase [unclassified Methylobacterium]